MRTLINAALAAASAVVLLVPVSSAAVPMSAEDDDGSVSIYVKGEGLHVDHITVSSDKQRNGEKFRVYQHTGSAASISHVTRWKEAQFHDAGMTEFAMVSWKVDKNFAHGTWLCAEATRSSGNPCIQVRR